MARYDYDIGVIGGGAAGLTVAAGAARLGVKVLLVDKEDRLGGDCLHYGCVPSKTLISSARARYIMANAADYGLPPIELPPVEFSSVARRISCVINEIQKHDSVERFNALGVEVRFGNARFTDNHNVLINGESLSAGKWVLATGSSPEVAPIPGLDTTPYLTNTGIFSIEQLPSHMIVLGGGPIAIEMAQSFARLGSDVTLIQRSTQILSKEDEDMASVVMDSMKRDGVRFILGARLELVRSSGHGVEAIVRYGEDREAVSGDLLFVAMGRTATVSGLGLSDIGVEHDQRGVKVDDRLRTSRKNIYAAGDVTGKYRFTHAAGYEGGIIVSNAVFKLPRKTDYRWLPWCTYSDPELASVGYNERRAKVDGIDYRAVVEEFSSNDRALAGGEGRGLLKLVLDKKDKPLGVQIAGAHAGELLGEWIAAVNGGVGLATLAGAVHPYPTLGEINKKVAGTVLGEKLFSPRVRSILKFLFSYRGQ